MGRPVEELVDVIIATSLASSALNNKNLANRADMASRKVDQAVAVRPPTRGEQYEEATPTSAAVYTVPSSWTGEFVEFWARDEDLFIVFGDTASDFTGSLPAIDTDHSNAGSGTGADPYVMTADDQTCYRIPSGESRHWLIPNETGFGAFAVIASASGGRWGARLASNDIGV